MVNRVLSWIIDATSDVSVNSFDRLMAINYRILYLITRVLLGKILGKQKRDRSVLFQKLHKGNYVNPTFLGKIYFYRFLGFFGSKKNMVEVYVKKFDYKVMCPLNEIDYISLVSREDSIISRFNPMEGDIVVDIGAHLGRYTIISSKKVGEKGKVISIEANPDVFRTLVDNIRLNMLNNVILLNCAVYSEKSRVKFYVKGDDNLENNHYGTLMDNIGNFESKGLKNVLDMDANSLDNLLLENSISRTDIKWIKIDVEGAELEVLKGSVKILSNSTKLSILVEIHKLSNGNNHYNSITNFLTKFGFRIEYQETHETGEIHVIFTNKILK